MSPPDLDAREARLKQIVHVFEGRVIERQGATATIEIPAQAGPALGGLCGMAGFLPIFKEQQFRVGDGAFYRYSVDLRPREERPSPQPSVGSITRPTRAAGG
jgi:hypothetical protein